MKVHLHIGTHKTGTTSIQAFATTHRAVLTAHGILWPAERLPKYPRQHSALAQMIRDGKDADAAGYIGRALAAARDADARCLLLSGENFSHLTAAEIRRLVPMFAGCEVRIILYLRNIYDYALSNFQQKLKMNAADRSLDAIVGAIRENLDYSTLVADWEAGFGAGQLDLFCFDAEKSALIENFFGRLGMPEDAIRACAEIAPEAKNESFDLPTQLMLGTLGAITSRKTLMRARTRYIAAFPAGPLKVPMQAEIAQALCAGNGADLSHPRLAPIRARLEAPPAAIASPTPEEQAAYLRAVSQFIKRLADEIDPKPSLLARLRRLI